jgi:hypothetical protein
MFLALSTFIGQSFRACECWQERKVGEKNRRKGGPKGARERGKRSQV